MSDADNLAAPGTPQDERTCMVLLVDDQVVVAEAVRRMLASAPDVNFHHCSRAAEAIARAEQIQPNVILQDLVMPDADGLDLLTLYRAHERLRRIPVIVLSSREDARVKSQAFMNGANDYLVKLPDAIELVARIRLHAHAYFDRLERDAAYQALRESQQQLLESNATLLALNQDLQDALANVKKLSGLLPICCYCKNIRNDQNYWETVDRYIADHSEAEFTHSICPACMQRALNG